MNLKLRPGFLTIILVLFPLLSTSTLVGQEKQKSSILRVEIKSTINPGALSILAHALKQAEAEDAAALILNINTPGGLLSTTREMVNLISEASIPIIGVVSPAGARATSAGAFLLLSTHYAVMVKGTNVGASSPISSQGEDIKGTLGKKVMNDTRAFMRSIAEKQNRDITTAEKFVTEALSLSAQEALDHNVIDAVIDSPDQLLDVLEGRRIKINGREHIIHTKTNTILEVKPRIIDYFLSHLAHPQIAYMLFSLGSLGIFIELISPGLLFPGIFGAISTILGLICLQVLPIQFGFFMLLVLGLILMFTEYFVEGFGVLGIGGAVAFILGSLNLFEESAAAQSHRMILIISTGIGGAMVLGSILIAKGLYHGRKINSTKGKVGEAMVAFEEDGYVLIGESRWRATTSEPVKTGEKVIVDHVIDENRVAIRKFNSETNK